jgi:N-acetylmuramoyl-L-alanine amidase
MNLINKMWEIEMRRKKSVFLILCAVLFLTGCAQKPQIKQVKDVEEQEDNEVHKQRYKNVDQVEADNQEVKGQVIVLDPGHSGIVAEGNEPLGPGSAEFKAADTSGTTGVSSRVPEYELTLNLSVQLKTELENRGYTVLMTRESNEEPVSCIQRAQVANDAKADAYVRIHANGSTDQSAQGAMTICTTPQNPYVPERYSLSRKLSDCIINKFCETVGGENDGVWETDSMSGNNWSQVPTTIIELGYMTNPQEDMLMQTPEYQEKMILGIAAGIDLFFE